MKQNEITQKSLKTITVDESEDDREASDIAIEMELGNPTDVEFGGRKAMRYSQDLLAAGLHEKMTL